MDKVSTDVIRRVFVERGDAFLEVGPSCDGPDFIELRTTAANGSADYFGKLSIPMTREFAAELGRALLAAALDK